MNLGLNTVMGNGSMELNRKERPILFSTPMVQAILAGRKTQTRRVVKGEALKFLQPDMFTSEFVANKDNALCPYGKPGDLLWVRETWCRVNHNEYLYKANSLGDNLKWKPSIHMPKAAARVWLRVTSVRVERLQDISVSDAINEGIENETGHPYGFKIYGQDNITGGSGASFKSLWELINGTESWHANPWVWVVEFERVQKGVGA